MSHLRAFDGNLLRAQRARAGVSRELLAIRTNRTAGTIENYERGRSGPSITVASALAGVLGCSLDDLLSPADGPALTDEAAAVVDVVSV